MLLKNEDNLLPLERKGTIALIGPLADAARNMPGTWCGAATLDKYSSLLEGMKDVAGGNVRILYAKGSNLTRDERLGGTPRCSARLSSGIPAARGK